MIFLALTYDTLGQLDKRAPEITQAVDAGKMVWQKYDCIGCHTIFGNGSYFAPDMTKMVDRKPHSYLKKFMMDPKASRPMRPCRTSGSPRMKRTNCWRSSTGSAKVDTNGWPPKPILATAAGVGGKQLTAGQRVYQAQGCSSCHTINGIGGTSGPDLTKVGSRRDHDWLFGHFKDPQKYVKNSAMPPVTASDDDIEQLTAYMLTLKEEVTK